MTQLDCTVVNCTYNKDKSCRRHDIMVNGRDARMSSETCCGSFAPKGDGCGCGIDSTAAVHKDTHVGCEAAECIYNDSRKCSAKHIGIAGGHADRAQETECGSFVCQ